MVTDELRGGHLSWGDTSNFGGVRCRGLHSNGDDGNIAVTAGKPR